MKIIKGDLVQMAAREEFDVIAHGCNCFCTMGSGIALQIKKEFPSAYIADCNSTKGDINKLGQITYSLLDHGFRKPLFIVNMYTQYQYGRDKRYADYDAIKSCMIKLGERFSAVGVKIGMPKIGCGLGGGDWNIVSKIIEEQLSHRDITIVDNETRSF